MCSATEEFHLSNALIILHVTAPAEVGGLESVVRMLAHGHQRMGHRVCVAGMFPPSPPSLGDPHPFLDGLAELGVEVIPIRLPTRAYMRERSAVRRLCATLKPSIVHTHGYRSDVVAGSAARAAGVPIVTTVHGFTGGGARNRLYEWIQEGAFRRFDAVVAVSRAIAERLERRGVPRERIRILPNAFDPAAGRLDRAAARRVLGIPASDFTLGWVGRLSREKGADVFLDAMAELADDTVHASILGGGPDRADLEQRAIARGIAPRLRWHGTVANAATLFAAFDAFVLSSRTEGIPIVVLEAMAAGTPIVAARVGGVPDMLSDEEAFLVPAEDPRALAAAIAALRANPDEAGRRAAAARRRLERDFALEPWLHRYEELYRSLARETPRVEGGSGAGGGGNGR